MREEAATREVNGVTLAVEHFGDPSGPLVLCVGGPTMLTWSDALCHALARLGRHVVRYDLRDSGASTTLDPEAPGYTLRDLASDPAALAVELDDRPAHPTCPPMMPRRWTGCSPVRRRTGPTAMRSRRSLPRARRLSATTPTPPGQWPAASGTGRRPWNPRCTPPTRWG